MLQVPERLMTERLILRRPVAADAVDIYAYACDPEVTRYMDWQTHQAIGETAEFLANCDRCWESGEEFCWVVTVKPENRAIGTIACRVAATQADFGYVLHRQYWGQGYATEAAQAIVAWLGSLPGLSRIWATCDTENLASARVLEKCGLHRKAAIDCARVRPNLSPLPRATFVFESRIGNVDIL
jgi:[ribosomal protein S5]-alanine N-acetyltransferase